MSYKITIEQSKTITSLESGSFGIIKKKIYFHKPLMIHCTVMKRMNLKQCNMLKQLETIDVNAIYVRDVYDYPP